MAYPLFSHTNRTGSLCSAAKFRLSWKTPSSVAPSPKNATASLPFPSRFSARAQCWNDSGHPMQVEHISIRLNRRQVKDDSIVQDLILNRFGNVTWILPQDDSVDLAILPIIPDIQTFDFKLIPISILIGKAELAQQEITEGESVFFAGFFYQ